MINSPFFPDWALEELSAKLKEDATDLGNVRDIMNEARDDMIDLEAVGEAPTDEETYSLDEVKQFLKEHDALLGQDTQPSANAVGEDSGE